MVSGDRSDRREERSKEKERQGDRQRDREREREVEREVGTKIYLPFQRSSRKERAGIGRVCLLKESFVPAYRQQ